MARTAMSACCRKASSTLPRFRCRPTWRACARELPFIAIPVFPRRLFSLGQVFVNTRSSFSHPRELAGRTIGLQSFQTTLAVLAKGDRREVQAKAAAEQAKAFGRAFLAAGRLVRRVGYAMADFWNIPVLGPSGTRQS